MRSAVIVVIVVVSLGTTAVCKRRGLAIHPEDLFQIQDPADKQDSVIHSTEPSVVAPSSVIHSAEPSVVATPKDDPKIPESLLIAVNDVHNVDEFLRRFAVPQIDEEYDDYNLEAGLWNPSEVPSSDRKGLSVGGGKGISRGSVSRLLVTPFAGCQPQKEAVKLENSESHAVLLWPSCVHVKRCGGCCTSEMLACRPTATSTVNVTVLQARYTGADSNPFSNDGLRVLSVEQHDSCACGCRVLSEHCTPSQKYQKNQCRCVCANPKDAQICQGQSDKIWDSHYCTCNCRKVAECSSGFFFNTQTCRCESLRVALHLPFFYLENNESNTKDAKETAKNDWKVKYVEERKPLPDTEIDY